MDRFNGEAWKTALDEAIDKDEAGGGGFRVLSSATARDTRPVLLWVHPGDAVEDQSVFDDSETGEELYRNSRDFQDEMGDFACRRLGASQVVILHRASDRYAFEDEEAEPVYQEAMEKACGDASTLHLFGDDLDAAARWLVEHLGEGRDVDGLAVCLIGAYGHSEHGCLAFIGQRLGAAGAGVKVHPCVPSGPGAREGAWQPNRQAVADTAQPGGRRKP